MRTRHLLLSAIPLFWVGISYPWVLHFLTGIIALVSTISLWFTLHILGMTIWKNTPEFLTFFEKSLCKNRTYGEYVFVQIFMSGLKMVLKRYFGFETEDHHPFVINPDEHCSPQDHPFTNSETPTPSRTMRGPSSDTKSEPLVSERVDATKLTENHTQSPITNHQVYNDKGQAIKNSERVIPTTTDLANNGHVAATGLVGLRGISNPFAVGATGALLPKFTGGGPTGSLCPDPSYFIGPTGDLHPRNWRDIANVATEADTSVPQTSSTSVSNSNTLPKEDQNGHGRVETDVVSFVNSLLRNLGPNATANQIANVNEMLKNYVP